MRVFVVLNLLICADARSSERFVFLRFPKKIVFLQTRLPMRANLCLVGASINVHFNVLLNSNRQRLLSAGQRLSRIASSFNKFWFAELTLFGLGYRISLRNFGRSARINLGYSHSVLLPVISGVLVLKKKKEMFGS